MKAKDEKIDPRYRPYKKGYFSVTDGHKLYYEACGNKKGKPVLFLHGGPGAGFSESNKRFFNPNFWNIILFDQRGAGRSKPFASLKANTTWKLIDDMSKLLDFFNIKKVCLFGGSWGSTLALVYAIQHPERVSAMVLRGIYLSTKKELRYYLGGGVKTFVPEVWERFISHVPVKERKDALGYYLRQMKSRDSEIQEKFTYEFAYYELSFLKLKMNPSKVKKLMKEFSYRSMAPLEAYYLYNNCFLPKNYILKNAKKLRSIPISIVQGRYDLSCPPINAYRLHKKLPNSRLHFVCGGHASSDSEVEKKLIAEMKKLEKEGQVSRIEENLFKIG